MLGLPKVSCLYAIQSLSFAYIGLAMSSSCDAMPMRLESVATEFQTQPSLGNGAALYFSGTPLDLPEAGCCSPYTHKCQCCAPPSSVLSRQLAMAVVGCTILNVHLQKSHPASNCINNITLFMTSPLFSNFKTPADPATLSAPFQ